MPACQRRTFRGPSEDDTMSGAQDRDASCYSRRMEYLLTLSMLSSDRWYGNETYSVASNCRSPSYHAGQGRGQGRGLLLHLRFDHISHVALYAICTDTVLDISKLMIENRCTTIQSPAQLLLDEFAFKSRLWYICSLEAFRHTSKTQKAAEQRLQL